jgi:pre-mRNA-splicing factor CWC22
VDLTDPVDGEEKLNIFRYDAMFDRTEQEWEDIKHEILGEENIIRLKTQ